MNTTNFLTAQNLMTLLIVLAVAVVLYLRVRRSQRRRGEHPGELPEATRQRAAEAAANRDERRELR